MRDMSAGPSVKGLIEASFLDWPGKVAAVVFLPGCNWRCPFCHNRELVLTPGNIGDIPLAEALSRLERAWVDGVCVTGGEPTINPRLADMLREIRAAGFPVRLDTNGSDPGVLKELIASGLIASAAMDIKAPLDPASYRAATGVDADVDAVRESIRLLLGSGLPVTFRMTVVPGLHDANAVRSAAGEIGGNALVLQNFRPADTLDSSYERIKPFTPEEFRALKDAAKV